MENIFDYEGIEPLKPAPCPELVIGIIAPAGAKKDVLIDLLANELKEYQYKTEHIKISSLITLLTKHSHLKSSSKQEPERTIDLMDAGDDIRKSSALGDALAILAISEIKNRRESRNLNSQEKFQKNAYLLDSLKHPDEVKTLRAVYGQGFILISGYSRRYRRVQNLSSKIASSKHDPQGIERYRTEAERIVKRDYNDEKTKYGQKVQNCFSMSDFFIDLDNLDGYQHSSLERFLKIIFDNPFISPLKDEHGMFHAEAASWRSMDLSRQVGAAICSKDGNVLSVGCNEVPKAFGGLYWEGDDNDGRDFQRGTNEGNELKRLIVSEIFERLAEDKSFSNKAIKRLETLKVHVTNGAEDPVLKNLQALNVIEYGRSVHAEMAALCDASYRGVSVKGATMYVNTFPCHICARHIIASGVDRVVYIEPYPKSLTGRMFDDSIVIDPLTEISNKVRFESFTGIAPRIYRFAFSETTSKKDELGNPIRWRKSNASTKMKRFITSYLAMENQIIVHLLSKVQN